MHSVIDKIAFYGVPNPQKLKLSQVLSNKITVSTLQVYSNPLIHDKEYIEKISFEMWVYPDGIKIYNDHYQILNDQQPQFSFFESDDMIMLGPNKQPPQYIYSFVLTDYELNRNYCTCIVWNEKYFIKDDRAQLKQQSLFTQDINGEMKQIILQSKEQYSLAIPKCSVDTMINNPLILDTNSVLVYVPKAMILCSKTPCFQFQRGILKYYYSNVLMQTIGKQQRAMKIPRIFQSQFHELIKNQGYPKAEAKFDSAKSETIKNMQLQILKSSMKGIEKDNSTGLITVQTKKLKEFFISSIFLIPQDPKNSFIMTQSGCRIGSRLRSHTVFHLPKTIDLFSQNFQNIDKQPIPLLPLPIPQFIQLWKCVLLQKQIVVFSHSQYKSLMLSQLILHLIQPIKWQNIYIPFLPFHLAHHIDAIGGYLIGMSRIHMDYMLQKFDMKTKVVVNLQHQTILEEGGKQVIELPSQIQSFLESSLKNIIQSYQQSYKPNRSIMNYLITSSPQVNAYQQKTKYLQSYLNSILQIQKTFFHALVLLFNNFIPFINKKQDGIISVRTQQYLSILDDQQHRNFMKQISKTMVFIRLCEYHVEQSQRCAWVQKTIGELFVYSHDILSHKFVITTDLKITSPLKLPPQQEQLEQKNINQKEQKVYAWTVKDLLQQNQKYYQYIQYLFEKNLKQIVNIVTLTELYLSQEEQKYKILPSEQLFNSIQSLNSIQIPLSYPNKDMKGSSGKKTTQDIEYMQEKNIYEHIHSLEAMKSKKYKKFGEKGQDDLYEQFGKICKNYKIERYLIKYIKYLELRSPQQVLKINVKQHKKNKRNMGIMQWIWDLVNPPDTNRKTRKLQQKSKLKRKNTTNKELKGPTVTLNLKQLFSASKHESEGQKKGKKEEEKKQKDYNEKQKDLIKLKQNIDGHVEGRSSHPKSDVLYHSCEK